MIRKKVCKTLRFCFHSWYLPLQSADLKRRLRHSTNRDFWRYFISQFRDKKGGKKSKSRSLMSVLQRERLRLRSGTFVAAAAAHLGADREIWRDAADIGMQEAPCEGKSELWGATSEGGDEQTDFKRETDPLMTKQLRLNTAIQALNPRTGKTTLLRNYWFVLNTLIQMLYFYVLK